MRNAFRLSTGFSAFILFIFLEGICFYLIVRFNHSQRQIYLASVNKYSNFFLKTYNGAVDYLYLKREINKLKEENARLRELLPQSSYQFGDTEASDQLNKDSFIQQFSYIPGTVVNKSMLGNYNTLTLDKGKSHGVEPYMGVIDGEGVVGIVVASSKYFSRVMCLQHRQARISASVRRTGSYGSLRWKGVDPRFMELEAIPRHTNIQVGDAIETSGYSNMFPKGLDIGVIENFDIKPGSNDYTIKVKLNNDFNTLSHAYVVKNLLREDLSSIITEGDE